MPLPPVLQGQLSLPVIAAPMFLVSNPDLVSAVCAQGALGAFPALNARTTEQLDEWLTTVETRASEARARGQPVAPCAVNLIVHRTNPRVMDDLAILEKHKVPVVITSLGAVEALVSRVHGWGGVVFHDVTNAKHARKAEAAGVDGLIAVSAGAGGHAGTLNPFALVAEIREFFSRTLILAGCLNTGSDILAALAMGADLAYLGTRFIATQESGAPETYKQMILDSRAEDIIHTPAVSGVPASFMRRSLEDAGYDMAALSRPGELNYGEKLKPMNEEAKAWKTVWSAGQGVGTIHDVPTVEALCARLQVELGQARKRLETKTSP